MLTAWSELIDRDRRRDMSEIVEAINIGMCGKPKEIEKIMKKWIDEV